MVAAVVVVAAYPAGCQLWRKCCRYTYVARQRCYSWWPPPKYKWRKDCAPTVAAVARCCQLIGHWSVAAGYPADYRSSLQRH